MFSIKNTKYEVKYTSHFKKDFKKVLKQGKDEAKLIEILDVLTNVKELDSKYKDHNLINNKLYKDCRECHIEPD